MKLQIVCGILCLLVINSAIGADDQPIIPVRISNVTIFGSRALADEFVCPSAGAHCLSDCMTMVQCRGEPLAVDPIFTSTCTDATPYCIDGVIGCSASGPIPPTQACSAAHNSVPFVCTGAGLFPDPSSCSRFYSCTAANGKATAFSCPTGVYDSAVQSCVASNVNVKCTTIKCPTNKFIWQEYKPNRVYFMMCEYGRQTVYRCADAENEVFDATHGDCMYNCKAQGVFPDRRRCNRFYSCTKKLLKFTVASNTCPSGYYFQGSMCVPETTPCVPEITG